VALKGDASQIPLPSIFQTLQLNSQQGVLTVSSGKSRRKLRIMPEGVRLLAQNRENFDILCLALSKQQILNESQFQNAISTMGLSAFPGDFLIQRRILTREQVERNVTLQFLELIYEIFKWKKPRYEFVAGDPGNDLEFFDPADLGQLLIFNIPSILMEVARRDDEWPRLRALIPSEREIYTPTDRRRFFQQKSYQTDSDPQAIQNLKELINGENTVEALINKSALSGFEVYCVLRLFLSQKEIRPLKINEKKKLAQTFRRKFKTHEVIEIYRNLLDENPDDIEVRSDLLQILERRKEPSPLLTQQYQFLANFHYESGDHTQAHQYLEKIIQIDPHNIDALDKLFDISYLAKKHKEDVVLARKLVEAVRIKKQFERGTEILLKILDLYPSETLLFHELADFFLLSGQRDNAVLTLKSVANLYQERGELTKLRKTYEQIVSIDSTEIPALRKITEAERRTNRTNLARRTPSQTVFWIAIAAAVIAFFIYLAFMEVQGRRTYAMVQGDVEACIEGGNYRRAQEILEDVAERYPYTTIPSRVSVQLSGLSHRARKTEGKRRKSAEEDRLKFGSSLARLQNLMGNKRYIEALALLDETSRLTLSEQDRAKLTTVEARIRKLFNEAAELLQSARELTQQGMHEDAHKLYLKLLMNFANTPAAQRLKIPLAVKTIPSGTTVILNGNRMGITPLTLYHDPFSKIRLSLVKEGFRPIHFNGEGGEHRAIDLTKDWMIAVRMERIPLWIFGAEAPVECTPLVLGERVYFGNRSGKVYCLNRKNGEEIWHYQTPDGWDISSGLGSYRDRLFFGTYNGAFHILDLKTGQPLHRRVLLSPPRPIRHGPSKPTRSGVVAINCGGMALLGLNGEDGNHRWTLPTKSKVLGTPELHDDKFIFATMDGAIHIIDPESGASVGRIQASSRLEIPGEVTGDFYVVGDAMGRIRLFNLNSGTVRWTYESPLEHLTSMAIGDGLVFFGSKSGVIAALTLDSGDLRWKGKVNDDLQTPAAWSAGKFYLGTKSGQAICLDGSSGAPLWSFAAGGTISAAPGVGRGLIILGSVDHRLYAFAEE